MKHLIPARAHEAPSKPIRLAIITPSFNRRSGLMRLHRSLQDQQGELEWCHFIVDDASLHPVTPSEIADDCTRVCLIKNERNLGPLVSRNRAIDAGFQWGATHFAFIDDDDYVEPMFFDCIKSAVLSASEIGWYVSRCRFLGHQPPTAEDWPDRDGVFSWFDDVQIKRRFCSDVMHVMSAERIGSTRFTTIGRRQREWAFLARVASSGGFYATNCYTKVATYELDGLTLGARSRDEDLLAIWNYVHKQAVLVSHRPLSITVWRALVRQIIASPLRLVALAARSLGVSGPRR